MHETMLVAKLGITHPQQNPKVHVNPEGGGADIGTQTHLRTWNYPADVILFVCEWTTAAWTPEGTRLRPRGGGCTLDEA